METEQTEIKPRNPFELSWEKLDEPVRIRYSIDDEICEIYIHEIAYDPKIPAEIFDIQGYEGQFIHCQIGDQPFVRYTFKTLIVPEDTLNGTKVEYKTPKLSFKWESVDF